MRGNHIDRTISGNIGIITPSAEGGYVGHIPEVPGCITQGETVAECRAMLKDALRGWVEVATNPWISFDETVPEEGQTVDLWCKTEWYSPEPFRYTNFVYANMGRLPHGATQWMPMPAPPKEKT